MKKVNKMEIKMTTTEFLYYANRLINSCVLPSQLHTTYAFLVNRYSRLSFNDIQREHIADVVHFMVGAKAQGLNQPVSSAWYDAGK